MIVAAFWTPLDELTIGRGEFGTDDVNFRVRNTNYSLFNFNLDCNWKWGCCQLQILIQII